MSRLSRLVGLLGVAVRQLRHERTQTLLAVLGVALAVLAAVLLASVGVGVLETGQQQFDQSNRDLWVTGGPLEFQPGSVGGFKNTLINSHEVATEIEQREDVTTAVPMGFQTVYVGTNTSEFETVIGAGAPARGASVRITDGRHVSEKDIHYADGTYTGPMTYEAVIDKRAAELLDVSVNDTIYVGGSIGAARSHEFTVVGISPTYSQFVGAPTVTIHLSELQEITGTTVSDRATFISIQLADGADPETVEAELQEEYPQYTVRTNHEQLRATLEEQAVVLASGASLVVMALVAGVLLLTNLQLSFVYRHRRTFGALKALGTSQFSLIVVVGTRALVIGLLGGALGIAFSIPGIWVLNRVAVAVTGFDGVVSVVPRVLLSGFVVSILVSTIAGLAASAYLSRMRPLANLD
ncbi:ABC transporter permease [Halorarum halophilum]|uniref:ABC transporter permease n=1 Tax=Halorarum halophilum TaxID=2743090 RepID=A0A7D5GBA7_9EURY|nr:ABC transporter permease [Halobaculum halophilum]QLG27366.1 ABC transporter permease [Halobaculum halophilum]